MKVLIPLIFVSLLCVGSCAGLGSSLPVADFNNYMTNTFNANVTNPLNNQGYQSLQNMNSINFTPIIFGGLGGSVNLPGTAQSGGNLQS